MDYILVLTLTILLIFSSQNRFYQNYLKEKFLSEYYQQLSFKYSVRICFIFQVILKSIEIADDTFLGNSECEWVKELSMRKDLG